MPSKNGSRDMGNTLVMLLESVGRNVHLETHDGSVREGKLTAFDCRGIIINGVTLDFPLALELNGDYTDHIDFKMIAKLDID
jgi:hypothetical protein